MVYRNDDVLPPELASDIVTADYLQGDYHRFFYGEIMPGSSIRGIKQYE